MKKILFSIIFFSALIVKSYGQCIPDTSIHVPGVYPSSLPHAYVANAYSAVLQLRVLTDTVYLGLPAHVDSIVITGVSGMPSGFTYSCTPSTCHFLGGSNACVSIVGTPPTVPQIGTYPVVVHFIDYGSILGSPQTLPDSNTNYSIVIDNNTAVPGLVPSIFEVSQLHPNPVHGTAEFTVSSPVTDIITFRVCDLLGNTVTQKIYSVQVGVTKIVVNSSDYEPGIYLFSVSNGKNLVTRRMILSGNQ